MIEQRSKLYSDAWLTALIAFALLANRPNVHADDNIVHVLAAHKGTINSMAFSSDSRLLASGDDQEVRIWSVKTGELVTKIENVCANSLTFAERDKLLLVGQYFEITGFDAKSGEKKLTLKTKTETCNRLSIFPDGRRVLSCPGPFSSIVSIWDLQKHEPTDLKAHIQPVRCAATAPNSGEFVTADSKGTIILWDKNLKEKCKAAQGYSVNCIAYSSDGTSVATGGTDGVVMYDSKSLKEMSRTGSQPGAVESIAFSRDGRFIVGTFVDSKGPAEIWKPQIRVWECGSCKQRASITAHQFSLKTDGLAQRLYHIPVILFSDDGTHFSSAGSNGRIIIRRTSFLPSD